VKYRPYTNTRNTIYTQKNRNIYTQKNIQNMYPKVGLIEEIKGEGKEKKDSE
jgi:hypothetical protein